MKSYILLCVVVFAVAVADKKKCKSDDDCGIGECCAQKMIWSTRVGDCEKIGEEGDKCMLDEIRRVYFEGRQMYHCPCKEGLECVPEEVLELGGRKLKTNPTCRAAGTGM